MYWTEKIDLLKKKYPAADFKDPFTDGKQVIEKIIARLFKTTWLNFTQAENKATLLRHGGCIKTITVEQLYKKELPGLQNGRNYWLLMLNLPMDLGYKVYDCKYEPLKELLLLSSGQMKQEVCVVDKKYEWLLFFEIDNNRDAVKIYQAGRNKNF